MPHRNPANRWAVEPTPGPIVGRLAAPVPGSIVAHGHDGMRTVRIGRNVAGGWQVFTLNRCPRSVEVDSGRRRVGRPFGEGRDSGVIDHLVAVLAAADADRSASGQVVGHRPISGIKPGQRAEKAVWRQGGRATRGLRRARHRRCRADCPGVVGCSRSGVDRTGRAERGVRQRALTSIPTAVGR
jgi:hypothetical protein